MQIKASEFYRIKYERKKKRNNSGDICSDTIVKSPVHTNPDIFKSAFIYIFLQESTLRLVFRPHMKPMNPLTETLGYYGKAR